MKNISLLWVLSALLITAACSSSSTESHYSSAWDEAFSQAMVGTPAKK